MQEVMIEGKVVAVDADKEKGDGDDAQDEMRETEPAEARDPEKPRIREEL